MLGDLLGRGGMAEVFSGYVLGSHGFQKPVAIKRLLPELANDHVFVERLIGEAKLLVGMQHGNIVSVLDLARDGDDVFLVMEYVDGPSLRQLLKARGSRRLSLGTATYIVQSAAAGLEFAHSRPGGAVIHADISPSNVLLTTSGEVRVADFGIARREGGSAGVVEGKWAYMAPEQARGEPLAPRSDVFALGVVLYELITGHHPLGQKITAGERDSGPIRIAPPRSIDPSIPTGLDAICMKALADNARDRYARMQHLIDALIDERFANQWRDGANDLAQVIREIAPGAGPATGGPRTQVTDRPVTLMTRSLISQPAVRAPLQPNAPSDDSIETLEAPSRSPRGSTPLPMGVEQPSGARTSVIEIPSAGAPLHVPSSGARTAILEALPGDELPALATQEMPAQSPMAMMPMAMPVMAMPPMPALRGDGTPPIPYRLSSSALPHPELASVHGGATMTGAAAIDIRERGSKWTFLVFGAAALIGVVAAITLQITPSRDASLLSPPLRTELPAIVEQPVADDTATQRAREPDTSPVAPPIVATPTVPVAPATPPAESAEPSPQIADTTTPPTEGAAPFEDAEATASAVEADREPAVKPADEAAPGERDRKADAPKQRKVRSNARKSSASAEADATLRVNTVNGVDDPLWAWVMVDGQKAYAPAKLKLPAGRYTIRVSNPDYRTRSCTVHLEPGRVTTVKVDLEENRCEVY